LPDHASTSHLLLSSLSRGGVSRWLRKDPAGGVENLRWGFLGQLRLRCTQILGRRKQELRGAARTILSPPPTPLLRCRASTSTFLLRTPRKTARGSTRGWARSLLTLHCRMTASSLTPQPLTCLNPSLHTAGDKQFCGASKLRLNPPGDRAYSYCPCDANTSDGHGNASVPRRV